MKLLALYRDLFIDWLLSKGEAIFAKLEGEESDL